MPVYAVSYDLIKRKDYPELWAELKRLNAKRLLLSEWGVRTADGITASALRDHFKAFIDSDDRLVVIQIDGDDWASINAMSKIAEL